MPLAAGQRLGRYEIRSLIGTGGMGEVYLAHDTKLERKVALKVLLGAATTSDDRLRRFAQEARAASALNHPNIVTVHDVDVEDGTRFITTEFVDGETLRSRLRRGRLPLAEALRIAMQVADALSAAHRDGIIHRDIKPENILLRPDGYVKVVDFGLAKLTDAADDSEQTLVQTRVAHDTDVGVVLGTVAYMSPEQARGLRVDQRSDIWSLGVVLYEMITARRPFDGPTSSDIIALILHKDPPKVSPLAPEATSEIELVLETALAKDVDERYQTARDFLNALKRVRRHLDADAESQRAAPSDPSGTGVASAAAATLTPVSGLSTAVAVPAPSTERTQSSAEIISHELRRHRKAVLGILAGLAVLAGLGGYAAYRQLARGHEPLPFEHFTITRLTTSGNVIDAMVSPDGRYVVHTVGDGSSLSLWVRQVKTDSNVNIVPAAPVMYLGLAFSRDGDYVYYVVRDPQSPMAALYQIPVLGGSPRHVLDDIDSNPTFSPDGTQLAFLRGYPKEHSTSVVVANIDGSGEHRLATVVSPDFFPIGPGERTGPAWSPDGRSIAAPKWSNIGAVVAVVNVADGSIRTLATKTWYNLRRVGWLADSSAVLAATAENSASYLQHQVWAIPVSGAAPRKITSDLNDYAGMSTTSAGDAFVAVQISATAAVWVAPGGDAARARAITSGGPSVDGGGGLTWTPDGRLIYFTVSKTSGDLVSVKPDGSDKRSVAVDAGFNVHPAVSPDGRYVFFQSDRAHTSMDIWRSALDGSGAIRLTSASDGVGRPSVSPDGRTLTYSTGGTVWRIPVDGGTPAAMTPVGGDTGNALVSPDGRFFVCTYRATMTAPRQLAIFPFAGGTPVRVVDLSPTMWGEHTKWSPDSRAIEFVDTRAGVSNIWALAVDTGVTSQVTHFSDGNIFDFAWSVDGAELAVSRGSQSSDAVLITDAK
jgi:eukaryotic-like serine/threonine-protein kinase